MANYIAKKTLYDIMEYVYRLWSKNTVNRIKMEDLVNNIKLKTGGYIPIVRGSGLQNHEYNWTLHLIDESGSQLYIVNSLTSEVFLIKTHSTVILNYLTNNSLYMYVREGFKNAIKVVYDEDLNWILINALRGYYTMILLRFNIREHLKNNYVLNQFDRYFYIRKTKEWLVILLNTWGSR